MKTKCINTHVNDNQTTNQSSSQAAPLYEEIKLGIDLHVESLQIVRMIDGSTPQAPIRLGPGQLEDYIRKQLALAKRVYSCYEAGPCGFGLHRQLTQLGVENKVVRPVCLDNQHKGVNTDNTDATELALRLDRYLRGNQKAFSIVRVPTVEEEQRRDVSRQREQLSREKRRLAAMGRSLLLKWGFRRKGDWWQQRCWKHLEPMLNAPLIERLEVWRRLIEAVQEQLTAVSRQVQAQSPRERPKGLGQLTLASIRNEVCDFGRFNNRKEVGSYTGLCGGVSASGQQHHDLSITKHGNPRLRWLLIELAWRMVMYQSQCKAVQRWKPVLLNPKAHVRARKRAIVALARQMAVDLWRWQTGRIKPEQLGWVMVSD